MSPHQAPQPYVHGINVSPRTQCAHWHSPLDIIAIKHYCCGKFYACVSCHDEGEDHVSVPWPRSVWQGKRKGKMRRFRDGDRNEGKEGEGQGRGIEEEGEDESVEGVVFCGKCKAVLGVGEYLGCDSRCPKCDAVFNPGCKHHWDLYFEVDGDGKEEVKKEDGR
ncbi:hypothetical protein K491DRAFT_689738 [Lophiostoma macrostomum CBS 122681]|uniref:CHY-type domain-containing protein n=1 Tax=Lophiostoma macrostomum CBS 122681 TaxID=1314788 RepID=A0A6A6THR7_9PLEO|nr:hypothetical protein K491DRAFT_689738 [Lophiostoma macrostomum CBS 122681]